MSAVREELIQQHIIHEFDRDLVLANLGGCYGAVSRRYYRRLLRAVLGRAVLDAGCGFGLFSRVCLDAGLRVHSIDIDEESLAIARSWCRIECHNESVYHTSLADNSVSTVVLNDTICHLEIPDLLAEVRRLGARRVIVHDSNLNNLLLRTYRRATGHQEHHDHDPRTLIEPFADGGFARAELTWVNFLCLPVSGGLQRRPLPLLARFPGPLFAVDRLAEHAARLVRLDALLSFRFTAIFDRTGG